MVFYLITNRQISFQYTSFAKAKLKPNNLRYYDFALKSLCFF